MSEEKTIKLDRKCNSILLPMASGSTYEIDRGSFKTGYAVCELATMLREKSWVTDAHIVEVLEIAFAAPGFLISGTEACAAIDAGEGGKRLVSHDAGRDIIDFHVLGYAGYHFPRPKSIRDLLERVVHLCEKEGFSRSAILDFVRLCAKIEGIEG